MLKRAVLIGTGILLVSILFAGILSLTKDYSFNGVVYEHPEIAPPIVLTTSDKTRFSLSDYKDKIVLVFFGYTSCPDVCPSTLSDLKQVLGKLKSDQAEKVQVVFITVDPERDTVEKLDGYVSLFSPSFIGLTGNEDELARIWRDYGVFREIDKSTQTSAGYLVNHSARLYLINPEGKLFLTYSFGTSPNLIAQDLLYLLRS